MLFQPILKLKNLKQQENWIWKVILGLCDCIIVKKELWEERKIQKMHLEGLPFHYFELSNLLIMFSTVLSASVDSSGVCADSALRFGDFFLARILVDLPE